MEENNKSHENDQAITSLEQPESSHRRVKIEDDVKFKSNFLSSTTNNCGCSKSRQHLTEAEKEARRLRRVLANRESARQTIRRRQAMFEELTRKAVDLQVENDNLKEDKDLATNEYESLRRTNDCLKAQVMEMMNLEAELEEKSEPSNCEKSTSEPTTIPNVPYNLAPTVPFHWPMMFQPADTPMEQCRSGSDIATPLVPMMQLWTPDSFLGQGNSVVIANPGTFLCVLPFPCFFPVHAPSSTGHPQSSQLDEKQNGTSALPQCTASVSSGEVCQQVGFGLPSDGGGQGEALHRQRMVLVPAPLNCIRPVASIGPFTALNQNDPPNVVPVPSTEEDTSATVSNESQGEAIQPSNKAADTVAASEARKRRKELMKLKNFNPHPW